MVNIQRILDKSKKMSLHITVISEDTALFNEKKIVPSPLEIRPSCEIEQCLKCGLVQMRWLFVPRLVSIYEEIFRRRHFFELGMCVFYFRVDLSKTCCARQNS
jgi:hypothetical protein